MSAGCRSRSSTTEYIDPAAVAHMSAVKAPVPWAVTPPTSPRTAAAAAAEAGDTGGCVGAPPHITLPFACSAGVPGVHVLPPPFARAPSPPAPRAGTPASAPAVAPTAPVAPPTPTPTPTPPTSSTPTTPTPPPTTPTPVRDLVTRRRLVRLGVHPAGVAAGCRRSDSASLVPAAVVPRSTAVAALAAQHVDFTVPDASNGTLWSLSWGCPTHAATRWLLAAGDSKGRVSVIDAAPAPAAAGVPHLLGCSRRHDATVTGVHFLPRAAGRVLTSGYDGRLVAHQLDAGVDQRPRRMTAHSAWHTATLHDTGGVAVTASDVVRGGATAVLGTAAGDVRLVATHDGVVAHTHQAHTLNKRVNSVHCHPAADAVFATAGNDGCVSLWDVRRLDTPVNSTDAGSPVSSVRFSPCGRALLATTRDAKIRVWRNLVQAWTPHAASAVSHVTHTGKFMRALEATWHPTLPDVVVVGRNSWYCVGSVTAGQMCRPVDCLDMAAGRRAGTVLHTYTHPATNKLCAINTLRHDGRAMATATGGKVVVWRHR